MILPDLNNGADAAHADNLMFFHNCFLLAFQGKKIMLKFSWNSSTSMVIKYMDDSDIGNPEVSRHPCQKRKKQISETKSAHIESVNTLKNRRGKRIWFKFFCLGKAREELFYE